VRRLPINHTLIDTLTVQTPAYAPPAAHHLRRMQRVDGDGQFAGQPGSSLTTNHLRVVV
jgi:hypothetical protein